MYIVFSCVLCILWTCLKEYKDWTSIVIEMTDKLRLIKI